MLNAHLIHDINTIFVTEWLEEMDDEDRMEFEGKFSLVSSLFFPIISNFDSEIVLRTSRLHTPSMVIVIVRRHLALLLEKQRIERADA